MAFHGIFDAGDGRVLMWLASEPGGPEVLTHNDGTAVPFGVAWVWNDETTEGSAGSGWEFKSVGPARKRFATEVAKALGSTS